jgi:hypothetical protein
VTSDNGVVTLSVMAQNSYSLMVSGQAKTPVLSVCFALDASDGDFMNDSRPGHIDSR